MSMSMKLWNRTGFRCIYRLVTNRSELGSALCWKCFVMEPTPSSLETEQYSISHSFQSVGSGLECISLIIFANELASYLRSESIRIKFIDSPVNMSMHGSVDGSILATKTQIR